MIDNPFWDQLQPLAVASSRFTWRGPQVGAPPDDHSKASREQMDAFLDGWLMRAPLANQYSWSIPDEDTVLFVADHSGGALIDPIAGTGYWCYVLAQLGVDCVASDQNPPTPDLKDNQWHQATSQFRAVEQVDAVQAVTAGDPARTLLLSWPPGDATAHNVLNAYRGDRLIYIGEDAICADDSFFNLLDKQWTPIAAHMIVQWFGIHDYVAVFERRSLSGNRVRASG